MDENTVVASPGNDGLKEAPSWIQDRRLEFVDFRLLWEGRLNRSDLTSFFGISVPQASLDIARYLQLAPANATYDRRTRMYLANENFKPLYPTNEPSRYLNELLMRTMGVLPAEVSFLGWVPPATTVPFPARKLDPAVVVPMLAAIRQTVCVDIVYQSISSAEPGTRRISPHAVGFDGYRWHVRAYCHKRKQFRDFVIGRVLSAVVEAEPGTDGADDAAWHQVVNLVLAPNPKLSKATQRVIELDYGMTDGRVTLGCRQAVLFYSLKRLGLLNPEPGDARAQQIVLKNRSEVMRFLPASSADAEA